MIAMTRRPTTRTGRARRPIPRKKDNTILIVSCSAGGFLLLVILIAAASSGAGEAPVPEKKTPACQKISFYGSHSSSPGCTRKVSISAPFISAT